MSYPLFPETGMAYYKGKMMERTEIARLKLSEDLEPTKIPEKWKRLGIKIKSQTILETPL